MCLMVIAVADICCCNEQLKWVFLIDIQLATLDFLLQLPHSLFSMRAKSQLLLVAPQHRGSSFDRRLGKHVVEYDNLFAEHIGQFISTTIAQRKYREGFFSAPLFRFTSCRGALNLSDAGCAAFINKP